ncbi:Hypothetical_protein [Hexamita inflata]|uniref:Hypothetical_protein n=1 Tax=Hexamita inflata TaxID=28002 RepID=A0AA86NS90_9EUKA|nr:Hypothetical protein HINF_LOCUS12688 [Hexamita inflata]
MHDLKDSIAQTMNKLYDIERTQKQVSLDETEVLIIQNIVNRDQSLHRLDYHYDEAAKRSETKYSYKQWYEIANDQHQYAKQQMKMKLKMKSQVSMMMRTKQLIKLFKLFKNLQKKYQRANNVQLKLIEVHVKQEKEQIVNFAEMIVKKRILNLIRFQRIQNMEVYALNDAMNGTISDIQYIIDLYTSVQSHSRRTPRLHNLYFPTFIQQIYQIILSYHFMVFQNDQLKHPNLLALQIYLQIRYLHIYTIFQFKYLSYVIQVSKLYKYAKCCRYHLSTFQKYSQMLNHDVETFNLLYSILYNYHLPCIKPFHFNKRYV